MDRALCPLPTSRDGPGPPTPRGPWHPRRSGLPSVGRSAQPRPAPASSLLASTASWPAGQSWWNSQRGPPRPQPQGSFCSHGPGAEASVGWGGCLVRTFPTAPPQLRPTPWRPHSLAPPQLGRRCGKCPCHNPPRSHLLCTLPPPKQPAPSLGIATGASTCSHPAPSCLCGLHGLPTPGIPAPGPRPHLQRGSWQASSS